MKKWLCILLMLLLCVPALAEDSPFAPYVLTAPEGAALEEHEGAYAFVSGVTRVVAMVIPRVPDEDPAGAVARMMAQFDPDAVLEEDLPLAEGYTGITAVRADSFGPGVDQVTVMILSDAGDLLILSGYDLTGDEEKVQALLDALLASMTVGNSPVVQPTP